MVLVTIPKTCMELKMSNSERFERNLGFLTNNEHDLIEASIVSIAGAGGDGGMLAIGLARLGVGEIRLADPDVFEIENTNRQAACNSKTIGTNKAIAVGAEVKDINPDIKVSIFDEGITPDNVEDFVRDSTLVIDETEFTQHVLAVMLARAARSYNVPNLTALNIGFGALVTTFHPTGKTVEKILGLDEESPLDEIAEQEVSLSRWLPYLPNYVDLAAFGKVSKGEKSAPSIAPGVSMAASIAVTQAMLNIVGKTNHRRSPVYAPKALIMDGMNYDSKIVRYSKPSHYFYLGKILTRNALRLNPQTSY